MQEILSITVISEVNTKHLENLNFQKSTIRLPILISQCIKSYNYFSTFKKAQLF